MCSSFIFNKLSLFLTLVQICGNSGFAADCFWLHISIGINSGAH